MSVLEKLSDEEAYLYAILTDPSGLDQAEFMLQDHETPGTDGVWRAWPMQWEWFRDVSPLQLDSCGRSVGKSKSIVLRAMAFPFVHTGQEMVITGPELNHLTPIVSLVEQAFKRGPRLLQEMLPKGNNRGITHRPYQQDFLNGSRILGRIPQRDGKGILGTHPLWLEMDEAQSYGDAGWTEIIETLKRGVPGAVWRAHGVSRGVRDHFYKFSQPGSGWTVHRITAVHRPTWTDQERQEKIEMYGSRNSPDFKRNVYGLHGDASNPLFVTARLLGCVDMDESSEYNSEEYKSIRITAESLEEMDSQVDYFLDFPGSHKVFKTTWAGADIGWTASPTEILIFGEMLTKGKPSVLKLLTRIHLERLDAPAQARVILSVLGFYNTKIFSLDATGAGLPLYQIIQHDAPKYLDRIKGYNFSEKLIVDIDQSKELDEFRGDPIKDAAIERNVLDYSSEKLREFVDQKRIILPWDRDLIGEWQGQTWTAAKNVTTDSSGRPSRTFSKGKVHSLDAGKMMIMGYVMLPMEEFFASLKNRGPVVDTFLTTEDFEGPEPMAGFTEGALVL